MMLKYIEMDFLISRQKRQHAAQEMGTAHCNKPRAVFAARHIPRRHTLHPRFPIAVGDIGHNLVIFVMQTDEASVWAVLLLPTLLTMYLLYSTLRLSSPRLATSQWVASGPR
jgi:hypothetical protein